MPITKPSGSTGKRLLKAVKERETRELAARTAVAIERLQSSSSIKSESVEPARPSSASSSEELWERHDFGSGNLLVFSQGEKVLIIKKSPNSDKWIIDYEPAEDWLL